MFKREHTMPEFRFFARPLVRSVLFLSILAALIAVLYIAGEPHSKYGARKQKVKDIIADNEQIEALVFGSSHANCVNPRAFGLKGENLGRGGTDMFEVDYKIRAIVPHLPKMKVVFISISYFSFFYDNAAYEDSDGTKTRAELRTELYATYPSWSFIEGDLSELIAGKLSPLITEDHWQKIIMPNSKEQDSGIKASDQRTEHNSIVVTLPKEGQVYAAGSMNAAKWIPSDVLSSNVKIELYKKNTPVYTIANSTANDGGKGKILPDTLVAGSDYRIKITSLRNETVYDFSDGYFKIIAGDKAAKSRPAITLPEKKAIEPQHAKFPDTVITKEDKRNFQDLVKNATHKARRVSRITAVMKKKHPNLYEDSCRATESAIEYLGDRNIRIIFFTPPFFCDYNEQVDHQFHTIMIDTMKRMTSKYSVEYYNFSTSEFFDSDSTLFANADHLNTKGQKEFCTRLKEAISFKKTLHTVK